MVPSKVQHKPEGAWYPWTSGNINPDQLFVAKGIAEPSYINGCLVFALKMDDQKEWNCKKGWQP